jgi:4-hydroxy-tetrahydrodipicolinate reductase
MTKLLITGCKGRMGQALLRAAESQKIPVAAAIDMGDDFPSALAKSDTVIDFTSHHFADELLSECLKQNKRLVIGTTGHTNEQLAAIREASKTLPIVFASNYSVGVNTLFWLTRKACELLGPDFDLEVVEMHHRMKKDSPSGTARTLVEIGDVVGDHTVVFANVGERVELTHKASSRDTFANGAVRASVWLADQKPGLYSMQDVLGLK